MKQMPKDWKKETRLWNALETPVPKTSSNFNYQVRQRIEALAREKGHSNGDFNPIPSIFKFITSWQGGMAIGITCLALALILNTFFDSKTKDTQPLSINQPVSPHQTTPTPNPSDKNDPAELILLAQNIELIQDMDVIENLHELVSVH